MAIAPAPSSVFGASVKRKEDPRLITGNGQYVDDVRAIDMLYVAFLRSPHGHARIKSVNVDKAKAFNGVVAVFTGTDIEGHIPSVPVGWLVPDADLKVPAHPTIASETVRYTGEIVAAVVARSRAGVNDAVNLVEVEYEPLPAVVNAEEAMKPGAPQLHPDVPNNIAFHWHAGENVDGVLDGSEVRIKQRIINQRLIPTAMEPRGVTAQFNRGSGELTVWTSTQIPHLIKLLLALTMGIPEQRIRVIAPDVGGGFGSKLYLYAEEMIMAHIAKTLGKPVKWIEERRENYVATTHGRDQIQDVELGATREGRIQALKVRVAANIGAYESLFAPGIPTILFGAVVIGCYKIPHLSGEVFGVLTNTTPVDAYRGAGRPEAAHLIERMVDRLAREIGKDPVEVRKLNFIPPEEFPYTIPLGVQYDSGNYAAALDKALENANYGRLREDQQRARAEGKLMGIGISSYVEICGIGPSKATVGGTGTQAPTWGSCTIRVHPTGKVSAFIGASSHGQGHETTFAQLVASEFGIPVDDVDVIHGDTASVQFGIGTFGSRSTAVDGGALHMSTTKIKDKAKAIAAHLMEASVDDIDFTDGKLFVRGNPAVAKTFGEIALTAFMSAQLPDGMEPNLDATSFFEPPNFTWPFGTHICVTEVDRDTGKVRIKSYSSVDDCGPVINPMLVAGQVHGGVAQGIGQALSEQAIYDDSGQLLTGSLMDYAVPKSSDLPDFATDHTYTPTTSNPWGVKGIGEAGTIAASAAVVNSVVDALSPLGVTHIDMPLTPERVWLAIESAEKQGR